jgi:hypothetical protein
MQHRKSKQSAQSLSDIPTNKLQWLCLETFGRQNRGRKERCTQGAIYRTDAPLRSHLEKWPSQYEPTIVTSSKAMHARCSSDDQAKRTKKAAMHTTGARDPQIPSPLRTTGMELEPTEDTTDRTDGGQQQQQQPPISQRGRPPPIILTSAIN